MKVLIVDDHAVVRQGVTRLISQIPDVVTFEAETSADALAVLRTEEPDVVVLDINLGGSSGLELLQRIKAEGHSAAVVMFSMYSDPHYAMRALRAGASAYVSKSASIDELVTAIKKVAAGEKYVEQELAKELAFTAIDQTDPMQQLTNRETEILRLLGEGKSLSEIASTFGIAYKTVANACSRLKEKLGLDRTADLIRISVENRTR
ncbi:LuxR family transcriptional regulator [Candidatus Filomicrobium marinum]|uniref:LuxR family transcriptional regulator n=2 Tax=Filomicrobium TaxID=119044 RepID=A0A0D6JGS3_9HYPH|nr:MULTISPECIES: response regulator transcription factor [Filomicrobium]MCV0369679.1 response regulator transcription factor [Filomicrobium sp.]CFX47714.1 LuxR family transcriptional regulator [Candidatus Filomicrobium marinum]CPR20505.1 LuxR family transcriptional regulator [Candidatus Filomicrobium marinum]SDP16010.1 two component transcriptional regulator, LuxR family [Filomicrobium insigne]